MAKNKNNNIFNVVVDSDKVLDYTAITDNDNKVLGTEKNNDYIVEEENYNNNEGINSCIPVGSVGKNKDSLPVNHIKLNQYELAFESDYFTKKKVGVCKNGNEVYVQKAFGTLTLYKIKDNKEKEVIISTSALSGDGGNGCLPNSEYATGRKIQYYVGNLVAPTNFDDGIYETYDIKTEKTIYKKEHSYKIYIYEDFKDRGDFRIHPVRPLNSIEYRSNNGCISPYPIEDSVSFYEEISKILTNPKYVIPLTVNIIGNFNITVKLRDYVR